MALQDWLTALSIFVSACLALASFWLKRGHDIAMAKHKAQLDRVSAQLRGLYGPLYALNTTGSRAWDRFRKRWRPGQAAWGADPPPSKEEAAEWRLWMREVFMPLNRKMEEVILTNADLLDEPGFPPCFIELALHVNTYKAVIKAWDQGDYSEHTSGYNFPREELSDYINRTYHRLTLEQRGLLGLRPVWWARLLARMLGSESVLEPTLKYDPRQYEPKE